jgi:CBS domain containing-hemolysin-like protein
MRETTAEDLMTPIEKYPHIQYNQTIKEAISTILNTEIWSNNKQSLTRALLVFGENRELIGMVRRRDIMRNLQPKSFFKETRQYPAAHFSIKHDPELLEIGTDRLKERMIKQAERPVVECMTKVTHTVNYDDHITKIIYEMCDQQYALLPVIKKNEVIGVIRTVEIMNELAKILDI